VKTGRGVGKGCCFTLILFNLHSQYLMEKALEGFGDFEVGGQVKYTDEVVLLAKEESMLCGMNDRVIEIGKCCGLDTNM
jgi:hypothetical protein